MPDRMLTSIKSLTLQGERICFATCAKFTSAERLMAWLKLPGHADLANGLLLVKNVRCNEQIGNIYCCLLGAARYCQHFQGLVVLPQVV